MEDPSRMAARGRPSDELKVMPALNGAVVIAWLRLRVARSVFSAAFHGRFNADM